MKKFMMKRNKEPTREHNRDLLLESGIVVKTEPTSRESKFKNYADHAQRVANRQKNPNLDQTFANSDPSNNTQTDNPYAVYQNDSYGSKSEQHVSHQNSHGTRATKSDRNITTSNDHPKANANSPYASYTGQYDPHSTSRSAPSTNNDPGYESSRAELFKAARQRTQDASSTASGRSKYAQNSFEDELMERPSDLDRNYEALNTDSNLNSGSVLDEEVEAKDSEDEDVEAIKAEIKYTKQQDVGLTRDALRMAAQAEESGKNTLGMLGSQGERFANMERNMAVASTQQQIAEEKARELKNLNRSMFAVHVNNPFNSKRRLKEKEMKIKQTYQQDQEARESRRQQAYNSQQRILNGLNGSKSDTAKKYSHAADKELYSFEGDSEDDDLESEINNNLDSLSGAVGRLKKVAITAQDEIAEHNARLRRVAEDADGLDVRVHVNTSRLANIN